MQLFYNPDIGADTTEINFSKEESRHIVKVLRKKEGDRIDITNGKGLHFISTIVQASDKKCRVSITEIKEIEKPWNYHLHIAIAPTKMNDRYEWFLEKATEIGIDEITPLLCENSERKVIKPERYEKVIVSAMKQSLKFTLPKLNPLTRFTDFINQAESDLKLIAHCEDTDKNSLKELIKPQQKILILIGPEGDFSPKEIDLALQHHFIPLSLGKSRLRTETAGLYACNAVSILNS